MKSLKSLVVIIATALLIGVLGAVAMAPSVALGGAAVKHTNQAMKSNIEGMATGDTPGVTKIVDINGDIIAHIFNQRRYPVEPEQISQEMKNAIVAIEDHRFYEHEGVDLQGTMRALVTNIVAGGVEQGASTINQQYVKNYLLHVVAENEEEQQAAIEQSMPRKLREMRLATELDDTLSKEEILSRYLNVVPFGNHSYGIEAAARTYFGISAAELNVPQSAMLAGMVQSSEYLNPYTNYEGALERRNVVLQAMATNGYIDQASADAFKQEPLGILESPATIPNGCIASGNRGFFCDYVLNYLTSHGISEDQLRDGGLTIHTTLDPAVQEVTQASVNARTSPTQPGVAEVLNLIKPGEDSREIMAMVSSRNYGLDLEAGETYLPQPTSLVGHGAGSVFKIFTAAVALQEGMTLDTVLPVPHTYQAQGLGNSGTPGCPHGSYCVGNAGNYASQMTLQQALAHSPNTTFVMLLEDFGVAPVVEMAVDLGLRSYTEEGSFDGEHSIAEYFADNNQGSFTLGPTAINPLELSNVGATIASNGMWCEPTPIREVLDREGQPIELETPPCERVIDADLARALAVGMSKDTEYGTAAGAAANTGFGGQVAAKTGTTESNQSSAFLGFNSEVAGAPYIYNDGTSASPLCSYPVRQCGAGNLYGGQEPAETMLQIMSQVPQFANGRLPEAPSRFRSQPAFTPPPGTNPDSEESPEPEHTPEPPLLDESLADLERQLNEAARQLFGF